MIWLAHFFPSLFVLISASLNLLPLHFKDEIMSDIDALKVAQRIDTVLDILVAGDYQSAIRNLEILKTEILAQAGGQPQSDAVQPKAPWEV
jgi:hypothetical protein